MKIIPKSFEKKKFNHTQLKREGRIAIFERSAVNGVQTHYEVVRIKEHGAYTLGGATIEAGESYPSSNSWGIDGFTYTAEQLSDANKKFVEMVNEDEKTPIVKDSKTGKKVAGKRGRKALDTVALVFPAGKFTLKELEKKNPKVSKSVFAATLRKVMKENQLKKIGTVKNWTGRGRVPLLFTKN